MTERRRFPRIDANISAEVTVLNGEKLNVLMRDLSSSGVKIECDYYDREMISPQGQWTTDGYPREVKLRADLPVENGKTIPLGAHCSLAFSRRIARNAFQVGMNFKSIDDQSFNHLGKFIDSRLKHSVTNIPPEPALTD